jgi:hypothetical protein
VFGKDLEDDIKDEDSGDSGRVYRSIAAGERPSETRADKSLAEKDAQEFYNVFYVFKLIIIALNCFYKRFSILGRRR